MSSLRASFDQLLPKSTEESSGSPSNSKYTTKETLQSLTSFDDLIFLKKISQAKFAVYLVQSTTSGTCFALKVFPYNNGQVNPRYTNETRFTNLSHPNVISVVESQESQEIHVQDKLTKASYIIMEYASHGDFFDLVMGAEFEWEDKLVRTYFHQLIQGIEYLHSKGISHLDLKLENLLVSDDFSLKITDFDLAHMSKDGKIITKGTKNYRSPELLNRECEDPQAADIYSAGILLFVMKCGGILPHLEDQAYQGVDLCELLHHRPEAFWEQHYKIQKKGNWFFDKSFKSLFIAMTRPDPVERATLHEIKSSKWYQGSVYSKKELASRMKDAWDLTH